MQLISTSEPAAVRFAHPRGENNRPDAGRQGFRYIIHRLSVTTECLWHLALVSALAKSSAEVLLLITRGEKRCRTHHCTFDVVFSAAWWSLVPSQPRL
jgi:hypothetical protein